MESLKLLFLVLTFCREPLVRYLFRNNCLNLLEEIIKAFKYPLSTPIIRHPLYPANPFRLQDLLDLMIMANCIYLGYEYWCVLDNIPDLSVHSEITPPFESFSGPGEIDFSVYEVEYVPRTDEIPAKPRLSFSTFYKDPGFMLCLGVVVSGCVALVLMK